MRCLGKFDGLLLGAEELVGGPLVGVLDQDPLVAVPGTRIPDSRQGALRTLPQNQPGVLHYALNRLGDINDVLTLLKVTSEISVLVHQQAIEALGNHKPVLALLLTENSLIPGNKSV